VVKSVTPCDIRSDRVTSKVMSYVMSQDMSHIVWLGVWNNCVAIPRVGWYEATALT